MAGISYMIAPKFSSYLNEYEFTKNFAHNGRSREIFANRLDA